MNTKMSIPQWEDYSKAVKMGDEEKAKRIMDMGYQPEYDATLVDATEAEIVVDTAVADDVESILNDVAAGLENKEICERYGITPQKLGSIKKKAQ